MNTVERVLQLIVDEVADRVETGDLSLEDLNLAAVVLLNVKTREDMEANVLTSRS